jgi:DNA-binding NarL/FixJ family response regulator
VRVAVADDHALLRAGLVELLTGAGFDVVGQAGDAEQLEVLGCVAEGRSNQSIAAKLWISEKTVEACTGRICAKLGLENNPDDHRRVRAVLAYLRATDAR